MNHIARPAKLDIGPALIILPVQPSLI